MQITRYSTFRRISVKGHSLNAFIIRLRSTQNIQIILISGFVCLRDFLHKFHLNKRNINRWGFQFLMFAVVTVEVVGEHTIKSKIILFHVASFRLLLLCGDRSDLNALK